VRTLLVHPAIRVRLPVIDGTKRPVYLRIHL
jgi:hypothetical protein